MQFNLRLTLSQSHKPLIWEIQIRSSPQNANSVIYLFTDAVSLL